MSVTREESLRESAWRLEDSLLRASVINEYPTSKEARDSYLQAARAEVQYDRALFGLVLLSVLETPTWCAHKLNVDLFESVGDRCTATEAGHEVMLSGLPYIPLGWGLILEFGLLCVLARKFFLQWNVQVKFFADLTPPQDYYPLAFIRFGLLCIALELLDMIAFANFRPRFRLSFIPRTGIFCLLPAVISLSKLVLSCLWEFFSIATFLIGAIVSFAWLARMTLASGDASKGFQTFPSAINSMFVAGVSEEFVAVFLESYSKHRWVGLLWLLFLVIVHVLLLSLVLDTLVAAYMVFSEKHSEGLAMLKVKGMLRAFHVLADNTTNPEDGQLGVNEADYLDFVQEYSASPKVASIPREQAQFMFAAIDSDESGFIGMEEFCGTCGVINAKCWLTRQQSIVATTSPELWDSPGYRRFRRFVEGGNGSGGHASATLGGMTPRTPLGSPRDGGQPPGLDTLMNYVLLVNLTLVIAETTFDLNQIEEPACFEWLELVFSLVYLGEVCMKLAVWSFEEYWAFTSNRFDLFTTTLLLFSSLLESLLPDDVSTYANMLRLLRLFRVVKQLKKFDSVQFMVKTITKLLLTAQEMVTILGVVVFFFTMFSVQSFGGEMYEGNAKLEGTEYLEQHMLVLNYNDVPMAFGVWVVFLLQEYQPAFPDAIAKGSSVPMLWLIFPVFYLVGVSIMFELVKAFTIEVFISLFKERKQPADPHANKDAFHRCMHNFRINAESAGLALHIETGRAGEAHKEVLHIFQHLQVATKHCKNSQDRLTKMLRLTEEEHHEGGHEKH